MEQAIISGVTHDMSEAKVTIEQVPDRPGIAATVFRALADEARQRRHDRAERVDRRPHRHLVHGAAATIWRATLTVMEKVVDGDRSQRVHATIPTSDGCRSSARG